MRTLQQPQLPDDNGGFRFQANATAIVVLQPSVTVAGSNATVAPTLLVYDKDTIQLQRTLTPQGDLARLLANRAAFFLTSFAIDPSLTATNDR
ncbi:hypothetical protein [Bifidobacterium cuniculi]|uniref:hypothetical protein n=1 Tax=Bifidobacterium cuniculi TaxID=1688 RepID=UPI000529834C|nr:hypothetical protein [Bifidobacterium cuniculi]